MSEDTRELLAELTDAVRLLRGDIRIANGGGLNHKRAAEFLGISTRLLSSLVAAGEISRVRVSEGRYTFRPEDLREFLAERRVRAERNLAGEPAPEDAEFVDGLHR